MAKKVFLPYKGIQDEKRPDLDLFFSRALVFGALFIFSEIMFLAQRPMPVWQWFLTLLIRFALLTLLSYHIIIRLVFKRLSYEITDETLFIKSLPFVRIPLRKINSIKEITQPLELKRRSIITYLKESPQVIHFVGQYGKFNVSGIGEVFFYTTLSSYHYPEGLILITTNDNKTFGISPENPKEFIEHLQEKLKRFKGQL